ncbi:MAG: hypothetical protein QM756_13040 [Polyangiaceae bacterium]
MNTVVGSSTPTARTGGALGLKLAGAGGFETPGGRGGGAGGRGNGRENPIVGASSEDSTSRSSSSSATESAAGCGGFGGERKLLGFGGGSGTEARPAGNGGRRLLPPDAVGELGGSGTSERFGGGGALLKGPGDASGFEPAPDGVFEGWGAFEGVGVAVAVLASAAGGSVSLGGRDGGIEARPPSGRGGLAFFWLFESSAMRFFAGAQGENTGGNQRNTTDRVSARPYFLLVTPRPLHRPLAPCYQARPCRPT